MLGRWTWKTQGVKGSDGGTEHMINGRKLFAKALTSDLIHTCQTLTTQINVLALWKMTSQNKTPVISRELRIFFCFDQTVPKLYMLPLEKWSSMINILKLFPKFFLLIFFTSSHIIPLLFMFPLLYVLITLKLRDNSKKLKLSYNRTFFTAPLPLLYS